MIECIKYYAAIICNKQKLGTNLQIISVQPTEKYSVTSSLDRPRICTKSTHLKFTSRKLEWNENNQSIGTPTKVKLNIPQQAQVCSEIRASDWNAGGSQFYPH